MWRTDWLTKQPTDQRTKWGVESRSTRLKTTNSRHILISFSVKIVLILASEFLRWRLLKRHRFPLLFICWFVCPSIGLFDSNSFDNTRLCFCPSFRDWYCIPGYLFSAPTRCTEKQFNCGGNSLSCIAKEKRCDGVVHCQSGEDEVNCPLHNDKFHLRGTNCKWIFIG